MRDFIYQFLYNKLKRFKLVALFLTISIFLLSIVTYYIAFYYSDSINPDPGKVIKLVFVDLMLFLLLITTVSYRLMHIWIQKKRGRLGSKLQAKIVLMFSVVAVIPTIIISGFSILFFNYSIKTWVNKQVDAAISESMEIAEIYLQEHRKNVRVGVLSAAHYLRSKLMTMHYYNKKFRGELLQSISDLIGLSEVVVFQPDKIIASNKLSFILDLSMVPWHNLNTMQRDVIVFSNEDVMRAVVILDVESSTYLMVGRVIDKRLLSHLLITKNAVKSYKNLRLQVSSLQIQISMIFLFISLLLLFMAIWVGINFSGNIVQPLLHLFYATRKIQKGDLTFRIKNGKVGEEMSTLARAFNQMTLKLSKQRAQLINVYRDINERKEFIEAVLSGISSGVIAVTCDLIITLVNNKAQELLSPCNIVYSSLDEIFPEMSQLIKNNVLKGEITVLRDRKSFTLLVRIEKLSDISKGYIITFDDISKLVEAQRMAAWSDVARKIAHEIKNPITPIYLAAERLSSKYCKEITSDKDTFNKYISTIMRHTISIRNIVDEFAKFARMSDPVFVICDICHLLDEIIFSGQFSSKVIQYKIVAPKLPVYVFVDETQINHVFINIFKNACESIDAKCQVDGVILISIFEKGDYVVVEVQDNGIGFPEELMNKLTEPYVTTRSQGTGLGLAIVKKILDEHNATIEFFNVRDGGLVRIMFTRYKNNEVVVQQIC
ncbi:HAMP domain-containing protein [Neoehrlichia mikurensis]|uniref:Putative sensor histidine kinase NtrY-like n=1 Tax=Neoehrlichia mikurensis TaxID=89586 RepID=A0A9Q9BY45_9RICK|nr:ATP-binding protein [Neoehrlichia mikurensis]QXK91708.1 HAMP domain-containing protein [Neoehrlichia mikurensis]QXK92920.1 HAMP domain-containing protein [Neoehrlichia mikurensis]QXK93399.1 HAMP domain-containing protein [Neoehrlichia mikurensis]UTO55651.1 ATP-binding protein [Neoehrlichia mikurensis]UTO56572.1 ATP-binding protein [Neoehrlichia mikurensis]